MTKKKTIWEETEEKREILRKLYVEREARLELKRILREIRYLKIWKLREDKWTLSEIGKKYGVSRQRVHQLHRKALKVKNNESKKEKTKTTS